MSLAVLGVAEQDGDLLSEALKDYEPPEFFWRRGTVRCPQQCFGPALAAVGRVDEAEAEYESGLEFCRKLGDRPGVVWLNADYAQLLIDREAPGDREKATELQDEAIVIAQELGMKPHLERVLAQREILKA